MGIGPSDQSEEVCLPMTINGRQSKIIWKQRAARCLTSYTVTLDPTEQVMKCHHCGKEHDPLYRRLMTLLRMSTRIHHTREVFSSLTSSFTFHFHDMLTGACITNINIDIDTCQQIESPSFSLHHSCIGLILHNMQELFSDPLKCSRSP